MIIQFWKGTWSYDLLCLIFFTQMLLIKGKEQVWVKQDFLLFIFTLDDTYGKKNISLIINPVQASMPILCYILLCICVKKQENWTDLVNINKVVGHGCIRLIHLLSRIKCQLLMNWSISFFWHYISVKLCQNVINGTTVFNVQQL